MVPTCAIAPASIGFTGTLSATVSSGVCWRFLQLTESRKTKYSL